MTSNIDPTREQFSEMMKLDDNGPIHMLNLIRLRDEAAYEDGIKATGAQAYAAYGEHSGPIFKRVGGRIVWSGSPKNIVIGPADENWDIAFIAEYPNAAAFVDMVKDPTYQAIVHHRQAAVCDSRLIRMQPQKAGDIFGS
ncbi:MAG: DUF1330 domain-containing protein [Pseudomonadota bacterium]